MAKSKEEQVLERLLGGSDPDLRKFAKAKLAELKNPEQKLAQMLQVPRLRKFAIQHIEESAELRQQTLQLLANAVQCHQLDSVPRELLTRKNIQSIIINGQTILQTCVRGGMLNQLPKEFQTEKDFLIPNKFGNTSFHFAAMSGHLDHLPRELLTGESLLMGNFEENTALHFAAEEGWL